jgi:hypothetical protein
VIVAESHLPAVPAMTEASHPPDRTIVGGADGMFHGVAWGKQ